MRLPTGVVLGMYSIRKDEVDNMAQKKSTAPGNGIENRANNRLFSPLLCVLVAITAATVPASPAKDAPPAERRAERERNKRDLAEQRQAEKQRKEEEALAKYTADWDAMMAPAKQAKTYAEALRAMVPVNRAVVARFGKGSVEEAEMRCEWAKISASHGQRQESYLSGLIAWKILSGLPSVAPNASTAPSTQPGTSRAFRRVRDPQRLIAIAADLVQQGVSLRAARDADLVYKNDVKLLVKQAIQDSGKMTKPDGRALEAAQRAANWFAAGGDHASAADLLQHDPDARGKLAGGSRKTDDRDGFVRKAQSALASAEQQLGEDSPEFGRELLHWWKEAEHLGELKISYEFGSRGWAILDKSVPSSRAATQPLGQAAPTTQSTDGYAEQMIRVGPSLARQAVVHGKAGEAEAVLARTLALLAGRSGSRETWLSAARFVYWKNGSWVAAEAALRPVVMGLNTRPPDADKEWSLGVLALYAEALDQLNRGPEAARFRNKVRRIKEGPPEIDEAHMAEALKWYERAAERGHVVAMRKTGEIYMRGLGGDFDEARGFRWLLKAAQAGDHEAMIATANALADGRGTQRDSVAAAAWRQKIPVEQPFRGLGVRPSLVATNYQVIAEQRAQQAAANASRQLRMGTASYLGAIGADRHVQDIGGGWERVTYYDR